MKISQAQYRLLNQLGPELALYAEDLSTPQKITMAALLRKGLVIQETFTTWRLPKTGN